MSNIHRVVKTICMSHRFSHLCGLLGIYYSMHLISFSKDVCHLTDLAGYLGIKFCCLGYPLIWMKADGHL